MKRRSTPSREPRLRRLLSSVLGALALGVVSAASAGCAQSAAPPVVVWRAPESLPWRERIDQEWPAVDAEVGQAVRDRRIVGAEVAIVTPEGWSARGFGQAMGGGAPDERTLFEIGSVSKVFTGTLLADMARRGEVNVTQPAESLLPEGLRMPRTRTRPITLQDLSTHMSGFPRLPPGFKRVPGNPYSQFLEEDLYAALGRTRLQAEPGVQSEYSNYGVGLLGQLLVNRAGVDDYETLLRERITGPLGMGDTAVLLNPDQEARFAWGHKGDLSKTTHWDLPGLAGAGGIRSTARDMAVFLQGVMRPDSPISGAARDALTPQGTPRKGDWDAGLGWIVRPRSIDGVAQRRDGRLPYLRRPGSHRQRGRRRALQHRYGRGRQDGLEDPEEGAAVGRLAAARARRRRSRRLFHGGAGVAMRRACIALGTVALVAACAGPTTPEPDRPAQPVPSAAPPPIEAPPPSGSTPTAPAGAPPEKTEEPPKAEGPTACPAEMVLVEGDYCTKVEHKCKKEWFAKSNKKRVCEEFEEKATCVGDKIKKRYCIDKYEWPNVKGERPEVMNRFHQAQVKCAAAGKRMCSETEWTFACEGPKMKPFPYGYKRDATICNGDQQWDDPQHVARREA